MDNQKPTADKFEVGVVQKNAQGKVIQRTVDGDELEKIIKDAKIHEMKAADKK